MANGLIDPNELMFTTFDPVLKNRAIMFVENIPSFMLKKWDYPKYDSDEVVLHHINVEHYVRGGKGKWSETSVTMEDPIVPSGAQIIMNWLRLHHESTTGRAGYNYMYMKDIGIYVLGPVGDKVRSWVLKNAWIKATNFGSVDQSTGEKNEIEFTLRYDYPILRW